MSEALKEKMTQLASLGAKRRVVEVHYRKHLTKPDSVARLVEPYNFTQGQQDIMLRCFQLEPDPGWRFFMVHKIDRIEDGGSGFEPRVRIALDTQTLGQDATDVISTAHLERVRKYRDLVLDAIADNRVTKEEQEQIEAFRVESDLSDAERDYVHAALFHRCIGAIVEDGQVTQEERQQVIFLQRVLTKLGWGLASKTDGPVG